jgi:hypothetical protein
MNATLGELNQCVAYLRRSGAWRDMDTGYWKDASNRPLAVCPLESAALLRTTTIYAAVRSGMLTR